MAATRHCRYSWCPSAVDPRADGSGVLPASCEGELPGAGNPIVWHVDLLPEGRYQLRTTHVGRPEPNRFDDIGRWTRDELGRIVLRVALTMPPPISLNTTLMLFHTRLDPQLELIQ